MEVSRVRRLDAHLFLRLVCGQVGVAAVTLPRRHWPTPLRFTRMWSIITFLLDSLDGAVWAATKGLAALPQPTNRFLRRGRGLVIRRCKKQMFYIELYKKRYVNLSLLGR